MTTPLDDKSYIEHEGARCPHCQRISDMVAGPSSGPVDINMYQDIHCTWCGASWTDTYTLSGYTHLQPLARWEVTIEARVRKTITVEAATEQDAVESAHEQFTTANEIGIPEAYNEDTLEVRKIENGCLLDGSALSEN